MRMTIIERVNQDFNHFWGTRTANRIIQVQPYVKDTNHKWSLHRYIPLRELTWEVLQEVIDLQSGDKSEIEELRFGCYIRRASVEQGQGGYKGPMIPGVHKTSLYAKGDACAATAILLSDTSKDLHQVKAKLKKDIETVWADAGWEKGEPVTRVMLQDYHYQRHEGNRRLAMFTYPQKGATVLNDFSQRGEENLDKLTDYILYMPEEKHFAAIRHPKEYVKHVNSQTTMAFCNKCVTGFKYPHTCRCGTPNQDPRGKRKTPSAFCDKCSQECYQLSKHLCNHKWCTVCNQQIPNEKFIKHRHVVYKPMAPNDNAIIYDEIKNERKENAYESDEEMFEEYKDESFNPVSVFAWDIEVLFKTTERVYNIRELNENEGGDVILSTRSSNLDEHIVSHICCENIFTEEKYDFTGVDAMSDFLDFAIMETNKKIQVPGKEGNLKSVKRKSIWYAHNSMGYDSHFVHQGLLKKGIPTEICNNGNKLLSLKAGAMLFIDSLNHIRSSLDRAVEDFGFLGMKGFVPYKFWRIENRNYIGPIPAYSYFENCRIDEVKLKQWYDMHAVMDQIRGRNWQNIKREFTKPFKSRVPPEIFNLILNYTSENDRSAVLKSHGYYENWTSKFTWNEDYSNEIYTREYDGIYKFQTVIIHDPEPKVGVYDLNKETLMYCRNDVMLLAKLMRTYHKIIYECTGISPLGTVTSAGVAHNIFLKKYLPVAVKNEMDKYRAQDNIDSRAKYGWAVQESEEWAIASKCMHGGNTGVRQEYVECDDVNKGIAIDIASSYPDKQYDKVFPIGSPVLEVYSQKYYPCREHYLSVSGCGCSYSKRKSSVNPKLTITEHSYQPDKDPRCFKRWEGFICCDITPVKSDYHPMIFQFDPDTKKNIADCLLKEECWITFPEYIEAVRRGYTIGKVYMISRYKQAKSYWAQMIVDLVAIRVCSKGAKSEQAAIQTENMWKKKFGGDFKIKWAENYAVNPALNQTIKIILNSIWGKAAETIYRDTKFTMDANNYTRMEALITNLEKGKYCKFHQFHMNNMLIVTVQEKFEHKNNQRPDLSRQYMPAACYVTTYGRLHLQEMLDYYGEDVVLYDTDSVYAVSKKAIPPTGKVLGDWELEDCCTGGSTMKVITTAGPKFYGYKYEYGVKWKTTNPIRTKTSIKAKGIRLNGLAAQDLSWDKFVDLCQGRRKDIKVRQPLNFVVRAEEGIMVTQPIVKVARAPREGLQPKGNWRGGKLYPFGYEESM